MATPRAPAPPPAPPVALTHPAMLVALIVTAACVLISVTFYLYDTDLWHHLLVGKVIWRDHAIPTRQLWSWPTYGAPDANSAWLFRALVWPLWSAADVTGLFVWRWLTTLAVFAIAWLTARRMGARGFASLVALLFAAFVYRIRSQVRPETLVAVFIVLELFILESRRRARASAPAGGAGRDPAPWLIVIAWAWANTHLSYYLGFILIGVYLVDEWLDARRARSAPATRGARVLLWTMVAALAVSFVNPFGWRALWLPFDFMLNLRHELMYKTIRELEPIEWRLYIRTALPLLMAGWPLLIAWRVMRREVDRVEILLALLFTPIALSTQRFVGVYVVIATPFVMRDLDAWVAARRWPRWSASPWLRAGVTAAVCIGSGLLEWHRPGSPMGVGIEMSKFPVRAADFIAAHGIRGRGFNNFEFGAYQAWRFWPERERLPFMTGTPEVATPTDRLLYAGVFAEPRAWRELDRIHHFDYILVTRVQLGNDRLLDVLDADSTWAMVFADDPAVVFVRRNGPLADVAARWGYRLIPAGSVRLERLGAAAMRDSAVRAQVVAELEREIASSPWNAGALSLLANLALVGHHYDDARALIARALRVDPTLGRAHERLGIMALDEGRPQEALAEFERERALNPHLNRLSLRMGQAWQALGDRGKARAWYERELQKDPGSAEARDSLTSLDARPSP